MDDTCYRRTTTVIDVRHRTSDSTCSRNTAEERHHYVRYTLPDELGVRVMLVAYHTVCHHRTQQALDSAEHSDREGRGEQFLYEREERLTFRQLHLGQMRSRDAVRQSVEVADGLHRRYTP